MATIFHLALASEWAAARESGEYTTSTRGLTLAEVGFIHASRADQWEGVRARFYDDVTEPLVLLHIDTDRLDVPVVEEVPAPGMTETFPHIYGRLPVAAVVKAMPVPARAPTVGTDGSFARTFFTEMFVNAGLLLLAIAGSVLGMVIGAAIDDQRGPGLGGVAGLLVGAVVAARLYRRRHRTTA